MTILALILAMIFFFESTGNKGKSEKVELYQTKIFCTAKCKGKPGTVAHACNLSSLGGRDQEDHSLRAALGKNLQPYLKNS
jgi:hypothetical protein